MGSSSSDEENGVSDLENQSRHDESPSEFESGDEGSGSAAAVAAAEVTTRKGKKRKRQEADDSEEEKEVYSHAEKRRQKKKKEKEKDSPRRGQRQNSVWVGNLSYKTTVEDVRTFFAGAGETTRVHMPTTKGGVNRGFAYVDFATPEAKACAIALSEQPLIGRKLLIKDGDDFTGRPPPPTGSQNILKAQKQPPGPTLFLGNLGFKTTESDILEMLNAHRIPSAAHKTDHHHHHHHLTAANSPSSHSWIRKVRMGTFEDSGLCKGFAFVDFTSTEEATSALTHPKKNFLLNGRKLVVEYASPDAVRRGAPKGPGKVPRVLTKPLPTDDKTSPPPPPPKSASQVVERPSKGQKGLKPRMKPGASLASARRESVAIIPSQGKKIKF